MKILFFIILSFSTLSFARDAGKTLKGVGEVINDSAELATEGVTGGVKTTDEVVNAAKKPVHKPNVPGEETESEELKKVKQNQPKKSN